MYYHVNADTMTIAASESLVVFGQTVEDADEFNFRLSSGAIRADGSVLWSFVIDTASSAAGHGYFEFRHSKDQARRVMVSLRNAKPGDLIKLDAGTRPLTCADDIFFDADEPTRKNARRSGALASDRVQLATSSDRGLQPATPAA